jgi:hypothetical protein
MDVWKPIKTSRRMRVDRSPDHNLHSLKWTRSAILTSWSNTLKKRIKSRPLSGTWSAMTHFSMMGSPRRDGAGGTISKRNLKFEGYQWVVLAGHITSC